MGDDMGRWTQRQWLARGAGAAVATGGGVLGARPAGIGITDLRGFVERAFELTGGNFLRVLSAAQRG
jgi:hypothetical protein